jgi:hypothetical protein
MAAAAQSLQNLQNALAGAAGQQASAQPSDMGQAFQAASQAAQSQSAMAAAQAAGQMSQMAAQAAAAAQSMGGSMPSPTPGQPSQTLDSQVGTGSQQTDLSAAKLKDLGIKLEDWAQLPGELRDQILQAAQATGHAEYRPLIKRYFQEIARRGRADRKDKKGK